MAGFLTARVVVARAGLRGAALAGLRAGALAGLRAAVVLRVVDAGRRCGGLAGLRAAGLVALRAGAFAAGLTRYEGDELRAARFANAAAALSVTKPGTAPAMPRLAEIKRFLRGKSGRKQFSL